MTPEQRQARIEAAAVVLFGFSSPTKFDSLTEGVRDEYCKRAAEVLAAADEVVPPVVDHCDVTFSARSQAGRRT